MTSKRVLVFETTPCTPHVETGLEILYRCARMGDEVTYAPLFLHQPIWEAHIFSGGEIRNFIKRVLGGHVVALAEQVGKVFTPTPSTQPCEPLPDDFSKYTLFDEQWPIGMSMYSTLSTLLRSHDPKPMDPQVLPITKLLYLVAQRVFLYARQAIREAKPDVVYLFNGRLITTAACRWACEAEGVKWLIHERASHMSRFQIFNEMTQGIDVWRKWVEDFCAGTDPEVIRLLGSRFFEDRISGNPSNYTSFTGLQQGGWLPPRLRDKPYMAYFVSSEDEIAYISLEQTTETKFGSQRQAFETLKSQCQELGVLLVVRVHPHLRVKALEETKYWNSQAGPGVEILGPRDETCTYALARQAAGVVTYMSTVGMEALYLGKPVMLLGRGSYSGMNGFVVPQSVTEMRHFLQEPPLPADRSSAFQWGYFQGNFGVTYQYYEAEELFKGRFLGRYLFEEEEVSQAVV